MITRVARWLIARVPAVRALVKSGPVQRCIAAVRGARVVRGPVRFAAAEIIRPGAPAECRLRGSRTIVCLRHATRDVDILVEIFARGMYEPPREIAAALRNTKPRVLDLGGNVGLFGVFAFERLSAETVTSVEPDPGNVDVLRRCIAGNRLGDRWSLVDAAASTHNGSLRFRAGEFADSRIAAPGEKGSVEVPCVDAIAMMAGVDLVKIDIQGGEWPLLRDPRLRETRIGSLVMEWHTIGSEVDDPRAAAVQAVIDAGMRVDLDVVNAGAETGVVWASRL